MEAIVARPDDPNDIAQLMLYDQNREWLETSSLVFGHQRINHRAAAANETYYVRLTGASSDVDLRLANLVSQSGSGVIVAGTDGDNRFEFSAASRRVIINTIEYDFENAEASSVAFDGGAGHDSAFLYGGLGDETAELYPDHGALTGADYSVSVTHVEEISASSGGGNDQAILHDGPGADTFTTDPTIASLVGPGVWLWAAGFRSVIADASPGGQDVARLHDSTGDDTFAAYPTYAVLTDGGSYSNRANDFRFVMAYADEDGTDTAMFLDSEGEDTFTATPTFGTMTGKWRPAGAPADRSYYNRAEEFDSYEGTSTAETDLAKLTDSPASDDRFVAEPTRPTLSGAGFFSRANGFRFVNAYATGGSDVAQLKDSGGTDTFVATPAYGVMYASASAAGPAYCNRATGFNLVEATSQNGGGDTARLYDSAGDDDFAAYPTYALLANHPGNPTSYSIRASGFRFAHAFASGGGTDRAWLYDSSGDDTFAAYPAYAYLSNSVPGQAFYNRASYFDQVVATSSGGTDIARFFDSAGEDVFTFRAAASDASMSGGGYLNQALNFRYVYANATTGGDEANLFDSAGDDTFTGTPTCARLADGSRYLVQANNFPIAVARSTLGGQDIANLYDFAGNGSYWGHLVDAVLSDGTLRSENGNLVAAGTYYQKASGFYAVNAYGTTGRSNTHRIVGPIDYALAFFGTWDGDPWP